MTCQRSDDRMGKQHPEQDIKSLSSFQWLLTLIFTSSCYLLRISKQFVMITIFSVDIIILRSELGKLGTQRVASASPIHSRIRNRP